MKIHLDQTFNSKDFLWCSAKKVLSAEASDIRFQTPTLLYDDAYDFGIWVKSHRTGALEPFTLRDISYSLDDEIQFWEFENSTIGVKVRIWND